MSSLVIVRGRKKISDQQKRELFEMYGGKFIKLRHHTTIEYGKNEHSVNGFRPVYLSIVERGGKRSAHMEWHTNQNGEPSADHQLTFYGDQFGVGFAYLPDDPDGYNRKKLASAKLGVVQQWDIFDEKIDAEINDLAKQIKASPEYRKKLEEIERIKTEERVRRQQSSNLGDHSQLNAVDSENLVLENRIKELEAKKRNEELRKKLEELESEAVDEAVSEDAGVDKALIKEVRDQVKAEVWEEHKDLIEELKLKGKGWQFSKEYVEIVKPEIDRLLSERLNSGYTGNSNVG